jgi:hypothetical protein
MRPGERVALIRKIAAGLQDRRSGDIDLTFRQFGFPTLGEWDGDAYSYIVWAT